MMVSACAPIPYKEDSSPFLSGVVVNNVDKTPISKATIELYPWNETDIAIKVNSDNYGKFNINRIQRWRAVLWLLGGDPVMYGHIKISHNNYKSKELEYFLSTGDVLKADGPKFDFGIIQLYKSAPNPALQEDLLTRRLF